MNPTMKALRMQLLKLRQTFAIPWFSIGIAIVIGITVFAILNHQTPDDKRITGALSAFYLSGAGMQPWLANQVFPFAMSLSVTRRAFVRATALLIAGEAAVAGLGLTVLSRIESGTHGWFLHMRLLNLPYIRQDNLLIQFFVYAVPLMAISALMAFIGAVYRAGGQIGLWLCMIGVIALGAAVAVVTVLTHTWHFVFWFGDHPTVSIAVLPLAAVAVFGSLWATLTLRARV